MRLLQYNYKLTEHFSATAKITIVNRIMLHIVEEKYIAIDLKRKLVDRELVN
jgi:hypothetical protein